MQRSLLATLVLAAAACGGDDAAPDAGTPGPYDGLAIDTTVNAPGLSAPVDVVRDSYGIPHIYAQTEADAAFANGYIQAGDRISEMDLLRHFAEGRVAELFGALDASQIDGDITMRMHRFREFAAQSYAQLQASDDATDKGVVTELERYADGINQYVAELVAGDHPLDPAVSAWFSASSFQPWTPTDSLAIGYLQQWSLQYDDSKLGLEYTYDTAAQVFDQATDPNLLRRAGAASDLRSLQPMDPTSTITGFPNVGTDTGTRAKRSLPRPRVPKALLDAAERTLRPVDALFAKIKDPKNGSNNWVVGPSLAGGNKTILSNDPHLQLINPPVWHLLQITVPGSLDVTGVAFPGIPGVVLGHNAHVAWGATVVSHDANDFFLENVSDCGNGKCVAFQGNEVPLDTFDEDIDVGALGTITSTIHLTYQLVPHHGPIIPTVAADHTIEPIGSQAISVEYTGYGPSMAARALYKMAHATSRQDGFDALRDFTFGAQNWVIADDAGSIGWTTYNQIPLRPAACMTWNARTNPTGIAPFFVLPGDGSCEWQGFLDPRYIPHAVDPADGFLASANQDPVGETFDGDPLNGPVVDGRPLYAGFDYDPGLRLGRITRRLQALTAPVSPDDLASIQADAHSNFGELLRPSVVAAVNALAEEIATPGSHPDLTAFALSLNATQKARLADAGARLDAWTLDTPAAVLGTPSAAEIADSGATSIFNLWIVEFVRDAFHDEEQALGTGVDRDRAAVLVLAHPGDLVSEIAPETGESILCDDLATPAVVESCRYEILRALDSGLSAGLNIFGGADVDTWRWGKVHTLTLSSLVPSSDLSIPPSDDPDPLLRHGYPRHGDNYSVDASHPGTSDDDFTYAHGPSMRHITEFDAPGVPHTRMALPGGEVNDRRSPHYRDLIDMYWSKNEYFDLPYTTDEIIGKAESRTRIVAP